MPINNEGVHLACNPHHLDASMIRPLLLAAAPSSSSPSRRTPAAPDDNGLVVHFVGGGSFLEDRGGITTRARQKDACLDHHVTVDEKTMAGVHVYLVTPRENRKQLRIHLLHGLASLYRDTVDGEVQLVQDAS